MHKMWPAKHRRDATKVQLEPQVPKVLRVVRFGEAQGEEVMRTLMKMDRKRCRATKEPRVRSAFVQQFVAF